MQDNKGVFIVIDDTDGISKKTQIELIKDRLSLKGFEVVEFEFPQINKPSSYFVNQYQNNQYGDINKINPYTSSILFSLDRYDAAKSIRESINQGKVVITSHFTVFDMAHQGIKFSHPEERRGYFIWLDNLEYQTFEIPRPNLTIILRMPYENFTSQTKFDNFSLLRHITDVYDDICQLFPRDFSRIDCSRGGNLLDNEKINNLIWEKITPLLPLKPELPESTISKIIPNTKNINQRKNSINVDDRYKQSHIQLSNISNLLLNYLYLFKNNINYNISAKYNYLVNKEDKKSFFYIPANFDSTTQNKYLNILQQIIGLQSQMTQELNNYINKFANKKIQEISNNNEKLSNVTNISSLIPVALSSTVDIYATNRDFMILASYLKHLLLSEATIAGHYIADHISKISNKNYSKLLFDDSDITNKSSNLTITDTLALIGNNYSENISNVEIVNYWPRNELNIISDILYERADQPLSYLNNKVDRLSYEQKAKIYISSLNEYFDNPDKCISSLKKIFYNFDLICEFGVICELLKKDIANNFIWQKLSPRYGFEIPLIIDDASLTDDFEHCYELSLELNGILIKSGYDNESQYSTLLGHRLRCQFILNLFDLIKLLRFNSDNQTLKPIIEKIYQKVKEIHPLLMEYINNIEIK
jgi:dTMP kinase